MNDDLPKRQRSYSFERATEIANTYRELLIGTHPYPNVLHDKELQKDYLNIETIQDLIIEKVSENEWAVFVFSKNGDDYWKREINDLLFDKGIIDDLIP